MTAVDRLMAAYPRSPASPAALRGCRIISHRGEHDNRTVYENTLAAFAAARSAGVWGIECDIRWTADLVPVLCHDTDAARVFGDPRPIAGLTFGELRGRLPQIPSLAELVAEFGGNTHLMLEIKSESLPDPGRQKDILREQLSALRPGEDYHFLALDPDLLPRVDFVDPGCSYLVAELNVARLSAASLALGCGGLTGHYLLLNARVKRRHEAAGQRIGTGFISSANCLLRELNRGVEWIFSNDAVALQGELDRLLAAIAE